MRPAPVPAIAALALAFAVGTAASDGAAPGAHPLHLESHYVTIDGPSLSTVTNVIPEPGEPATSVVRAKIGLTVTNISARPIWVAVKLTPPAPEPDCPGGVGQLGPGEQVEFRCTPARVVANQDYALLVTSFADSAQTDTLERAHARLRFDTSTVELLDSRLAIRRSELEQNPSALDSTNEEDAGIAWTLALSGGAVFPLGDYADGYDQGGMGTASVGIAGARFGARLLSGSTEPGTRNVTNEAYAARQGGPVQVMVAIVPIELQATAALPSRISRFGLGLEAGAGIHVRTVRIEHTDERLDEDSLFGFSAGGGPRYAFGMFNGSAWSIALNGVYHGTGSNRYMTAELEIGLAW